MFELLGVIIPLLLLIYLAYRGVSVIILGPAMTMIAVLFAKNTPFLATYTQIFMPALGDFIILYFPLFLLGALFGKLMDDTGSAKAIAQKIIKILGHNNAILAIVLSCGILTYGGVSLFVVAFAVYPIAASLFKDANIPKRLIPATIALGAFTFTMTSLPGTPAIQNSIPMPFFGTTAFAAPGLGIISAIIIFGLGQLWLLKQSRKAKLAGEGYGRNKKIYDAKDRDVRILSQGEGFDISEIESNNSKKNKLPNFWIAFTTIIIVIGMNYTLSTHIIPSLDTSYLQKEIYGKTDIRSLLGVWSVICSLSFSLVFMIIVNKGRIVNLKESIDGGANASVLPIFSTASLVGFGAVISKLPAFNTIQGFIENIGGDVLISLAISVSILAGITGSASGGMSIALQSLSGYYMELASQFDISPELLHRVTTIATGGLDSLPHNGAVVTLLGICGLTHKQAYKDIFVVAVVCPIISLVVIITLGKFFGSF